MRRPPGEGSVIAPHELGPKCSLLRKRRDTGSFIRVSCISEHNRRARFLSWWRRGLTSGRRVVKKILLVPEHPIIPPLGE